MRLIPSVLCYCFFYVNIVSAQPAVASLQPRSGAGYTGTFTATFTHASNNHYLGYMLFLPTPNIVYYTAAGSCLVEYNRYSNGVRLIDDAGTSWLGGESGVPIASTARPLTNSHCSVDVANVAANIDGPTMSISVPITFFASLGLVMGTFLQAIDANGAWTGMTQFGNWVLPGAAQNRVGPTLTGVNSTATTGDHSVYTITTSVTTGASTLSMIHFLASAALVGSPACHVVYFPASNLLNLVDDVGGTMVLPIGITVGQPGTLANSRCSVDVSQAWRAHGAHTITLILPVRYMPAFAGPKGVYVNVFDGTGLLSHWVQGSTMLVQ